MSLYPLFNMRVATPKLELRAATDDLLEQLAPVVAAGHATAEPPPWDDPSSFYETDPDVRVQKWMQGIWRGRGTVTENRWRLHFVVIVDAQPVGMQDLIGDQFNVFGTVESSSWLATNMRQKGIGTEMRSAILHLAFEGLGAKEAQSEAALENAGSNGISERLGYERNGTSWATHQGRPVNGQRWLLQRTTWQASRRSDIALTGIDECRSVLRISG